MARKSLPGKEMVVVDDDDDDDDDDDANIIKYIKPVSVYKDLETRSKNNPYFLRRSLNYIIRAKKKKKSNSGGTIRFNYRDVRNKKTLKAEDVEKFSCPFCLMPCGGHEGLRLHLKSSHDAFKYEFYRAEEDHGPEVDVYLKRDTLRFGVTKKLDTYATFQVIKNDLGNPQLNPFMFCLKHRKGRSQRDDSDSLKRLNARLLELDLDELPRGIENESTHVNNDTVSSPPRAHSSEKTSNILTTTQPAIAESSEPMVPPVSGRKKLFAEFSEPMVPPVSGRKKSVAESSEPMVPPVSRRKKLFAERSKAKGLERLKSRQFYHSQTMQPMTFEEVMSNEDSENETDDDALDLEERLRLERIADFSKEEKRYMYLWNIFVRKQRVIADGHVPWACEEFTKLHKEEIKVSSSFDWWWRMFRIKLWEHGLICANTFNKCTTIFHNSDAAGPSTSHGPANAITQQSMEVDA